MLLISSIQIKTDGRDGFSFLGFGSWQNRAPAPWLPVVDELKLELWGMNRSKDSSYVI
jgi:hypothetical protein